MSLENRSGFSFTAMSAWRFSCTVSAPLAGRFCATSAMARRGGAGAGPVALRAASEAEPREEKSGEQSSEARSLRRGV